MYQVTNAYKEIMDRPLRNKAYISVSLGIVNNEAQSNLSVDETITPLTAFSDEPPIYNFKNLTSEYATCEQNYFKADGTMHYLPSDGDYLSNVGISSDSILGAIKFVFNATYDLKGLTIDFGFAYPTEFTITTINGINTYTNNSSQWTTSDTFGETDYITITPITMVGGQQRLHIYNIVMGVGLVFNSEDVSKATQTEQTNFISGELPQLDFSVTILDPERMFDVDSSESFINYLNTGQELRYFIGLEHDNEQIEWLPMANVLLTNWKVKGQEVTFDGSDRFSFMDDIYTGGNTIHSRTLYSDVIDLLTYAGFEPDEYLVDDCLKDVTVVNPLPEQSVSTLLQMICNAGRCVIYQDREGMLIIRANFQIVLDPDDVTVTSSGETDYSNPHNTLVGASTVYANCTESFFSADGTMRYIPTNSADYLDTTGFISEEVADSDGNFTTNPSINLDLGGLTTYYGLEMTFDGNPPQGMTITTYANGVLNQTFTYNEFNKVTYFADTFENFDSMAIEFTQATPNNRILINKIAFGDASDYKLTYENIIGDLVGIKEKKVKDVRIKIFTFQNDEQGNPQEVQDSVYYTQNVSDVGSVVTITNPLVSTQEHAQSLGIWLANYYGNNVTYSCTFRGEPRLNATDIIFLDSENLNNLQVEIEKHTFTFDGAFGGNLDMRRALRLE